MKRKEEEHLRFSHNNQSFFQKVVSLTFFFYSALLHVENKFKKNACGENFSD